MRYFLAIVMSVAYQQTIKSETAQKYSFNYKNEFGQSKFLGFRLARTVQHFIYSNYASTISQKT